MAYTVNKINFVTFQDFINKTFLHWQSQYGRRKTLDEFAQYLGVKRELVSMWMNGKRKPGPKYKNQLINVIGDEAADFFGEDPQLVFINQNWDAASEELQRSLTEQLKKHIIANDTKRTHNQRKKTVT